MAQCRQQVDILRRAFIEGQSPKQIRQELDILPTVKSIINKFDKHLSTILQGNITERDAAIKAALEADDESGEAGSDVFDNGEDVVNNTYSNARSSSFETASPGSFDGTQAVRSFDFAGAADTAEGSGAPRPEPESESVYACPRQLIFDDLICVRAYAQG